MKKLNERIKLPIYNTITSKTWSFRISIQYGHYNKQIRSITKESRPTRTWLKEDRHKNVLDYEIITALSEREKNVKQQMEI